MIRSLLRSCGRFLTAVLLLALLLCAFEVWMRWERVQSTEESRGQTSLDDVVVPSRTTWRNVVPLLKLQMPLADRTSTPLLTNEFGMRGPAIVVPKPSAVYRVLCLGGAGVFGLGLRSEETLPEQLQLLFAQHQLAHVEFWNAGCPKSGPLVNYLRLRQQLLATQPDMILYCLHPSELAFDLDVRGGVSIDQTGRPMFASHPAAINSSADSVGTFCQEFATLDFLYGQLVSTLPAQSPPSLSSSAAESPDLESLIALHALCMESDIRLIVSLIPEATPHPQASTIVDQLGESLAQSGVSAQQVVHWPHDLHQPEIDRTRLFDHTSGQLTPYGNAVYARTIANFIAEQVPEILETPLIAPPEALHPMLNTNTLNPNTPSPAVRNDMLNPPADLSRTARIDHHPPPSTVIR